MKRYQFNIGTYFLEKVSTPIRKKEDTIKLLMETVKMFLIGNIVTDENRKGTVIIVVDKMSRVFFEIEDKCFSINFPFSINKTEEDEIRIYEPNHNIEINNQTTSNILSLISAKILNENCLEDFLCKIEEVDEFNKNPDSIIDTWKILKKLILFEDGYLRYDHDPIHENGDLHPLNHYDFYYSKGNTFKIGLANKINVEKIIDMLDTNTNTNFLRH